MIWETLVGRPARASGPDLLDRAAAGTIPEVDLADDTLAALLSDVLQPAPEARPADASTVADELGAWLRGEASRDRATAHVAAALAERPALAALLAAAEDARRDAATLAASTPSHARRAAREALWAAEDAAREADVARDRALRAHVLRLEAALAEHPGLPEARQALADHYRARVEEAEAAGRDASADLHRVAQYDDGVHAAWLQGDGCLTLHTARPGATVVARPLEERGRRRVPGDSTPLGTTPLEAVALPRGSWLLELSHPGRPTVRYPVTLDRCEHWDGVGPDGHVHAVACPDALSVDEVFVPAGWFQRGRRHAVRGDYSPWERTWVDDWVVQRFCVTNADYLAFLDDLVVRGEEARALQHVPRTREGAPPLYGRTDDGCFCLVPDDDGDLWDLRWPVILVTWHDAAAYAAWRAERDGLPWQLLPETVWEKAGRGVDGRLYAWGDRPEPSFANARGSRPGRPMLETVDAYPEDVSIYGVRGLHGGVREWSADLASADGAGREERRIKGGCWFFDAGTGSLPYRYALMAKLRGDTIGFRIGRPL
jgi:serine/threonine-protein kinase